MKRLLFALLFMLPMLASAEHHRGHALHFIELTRSELAIVSQELGRFEKHYQTGDALYYSDERIAGLVNNIKIAVNKINESLDETEAILETGTASDLDIARRLIVQPNFDNPKSAAFQAWVANYTLGALDNNIRPGVPVKSSTLGMTMYLSKAWRDLDLVSWHIIDAIREEQYLDPIFICAGPNNHCD